MWLKIRRHEVTVYNWPNHSSGLPQHGKVISVELLQCARMLVQWRNGQNSSPKAQFNNAILEKRIRHYIYQGLGTTSFGTKAMIQTVAVHCELWKLHTMEIRTSFVQAMAKCMLISSTTKSRGEFKTRIRGKAGHWNYSARKDAFTLSWPVATSIICGWVDHLWIRLFIIAGYMMTCRYVDHLWIRLFMRLSFVDTWSLVIAGYNDDLSIRWPLLGTLINLRWMNGPLWVQRIICGSVDTPCL